MYGEKDLQDEDFLTEIPALGEEEFCIYGTVYAHPQHADALEKVYAQTTRLAETEPGSIYYCIGRDSEDPTVFYFFERYKGKSAFDSHNDQPVIQKLMEDKFIRGVKARFVKAIAPA